MLGGNHHRVQMDGISNLVIFHCHLGFAIRQKAVNGPGFPCQCQRSRQPVCQHHRQREQFWSFITGVSHHDALVACSQLQGGKILRNTPPFFQRVVHPCRNVRTLAADQRLDDKISGIITHPGQHFPGNPGNLRFPQTGDFSGDDEVPAGNHHLAGHAGKGVMRKTGIQHTVGDEVAQFVRMPFCNRFRCVKLIHVVPPSMLIEKLLYRCIFSFGGVPFWPCW